MFDLHSFCQEWQAEDVQGSSDQGSDDELYWWCTHMMSDCISWLYRLRFIITTFLWKNDVKHKSDYVDQMNLKLFYEYILICQTLNEDSMHS